MKIVKEIHDGEYFIEVLLNEKEIEDVRQHTLVPTEITIGRHTVHFCLRMPTRIDT